jgi:cell division protein FtsB
MRVERRSPAKGHRFMTASTPRLGSDRHQARRRRAALREALYLTALLATAGTAYFGFVLLPSKLRTDELEATHQSLTEDVDALRESIASLRRDTAALEGDAWVVERTLRGRLGYLRPGERVFRVGG